MPQVMWPLRKGRPCIEVVLTLALGRQAYPRVLLADSGAGSRYGSFQLILDEDDCLLCGGIALPAVKLVGAYVGSFPLYQLSVCVPALGFDQKLRAVGVPSIAPGFDGIACFGFLNCFSYGNFGDRNAFGVEG